jgi:hypothetical protein
MFVWSGSAWVSVATEVESLANYATVNYASTQPGMKMVVPTSVAVGSGSGSVDTNGAVTFSGASSVSLNGCFTSAYDNYLINYDLVFTSFGTNGVMYLRLRTGGVDNSTNNVARNGYWLENSTITTVNNFRSNGLTENSFTLGYGTLLAIDGKIDIQSPFKTERTSSINQSNGHLASNELVTLGTHHLTSVTTSYDGFSLIPNAGTMTGTVRVYGYKN